MDQSWLAQWVEDLVLLWLRCRSAAAGYFATLVWEHLYATSADIKIKIMIIITTWKLRNIILSIPWTNKEIQTEITNYLPPPKKKYWKEEYVISKPLSQGLSCAGKKNYHLKISIIERERQKEVRNSYCAAAGSKLGVVSKVVWVGSLAWRHGLRIQYCRSCSSDSTPDPETFMCHGYDRESKKEKKGSSCVSMGETQMVASFQNPSSPATVKGQGGAWHI